MIDKLFNFNRAFNLWYTITVSKITPQNKLLKSALYLLIFLIAVHGFYSFIGVYDYLNYRPTSIHSWAQCQRASIAQCYYEDSMNFFKPRVQRYTPDGGITGMEFPIIYYTGAVLYKLFGFHEIYLRLVSLIIVTVGLFVGSLLLHRYLKNYILSLCIIGSAYFSPVLLYYTPNFMPDAPGIAFVLMAWHFLFKYKNEHKPRHLNLFVTFGTLAALLKVISLMLFIIVVAIIILDKLKFYKKEITGDIFYKNWRVLIGVCIGTFIVFSWYWYARWLAVNYHNETFALDVIKGDLQTLNVILDGLKTGDRLNSFYSDESFVLIVSAIFSLLLLAKYVNRLLFSITFLYFIGSVCYVYLFLKQFIYHDYYIIAMIPGVIFLLLTFADALTQLSQKFSSLISIIFMIILMFNMKESIRNCRSYYMNRYNDMRVYLSTSDRSYYDLENRLRAAGIKRTDVTISGFDDTFCSSLYLMDQIGMLISSTSSKEYIDYLINLKPVKYMVLNDSAGFNKIYPNHFEKNILFSYKGVIVYKLK